MQNITLIIYMCVLLILTITAILLQLVGLIMYFVKFGRRAVRQSMKEHRLPRASMLLHTSMELHVIIFILGVILMYLLQRLR